VSSGKSRVLYTERKYEAADLSYLDLDKRSIVWPQILSEEAWSSYYQENYNRTLGKLVTYKAPLLKFVVNPEQNVLQAMSYMKMCLFKDVNKVVEDFYKENESDYRYIQGLMGRKQNPEYFVQMLLGAETEKSNLLRNFLSGIAKDPSVSIYLDHLRAAEKERSSMARSNLTNYLNDNIDDFVEAQRKVIGLYVASKLQKLFFDLRSAFESMSYIKLEILGKRKQYVYKGVDFTGKRGDIKYLKRNAKQYFWDFNGEFWADELGDYVFALPSECPNDV
jgi:hypothetical protein